MKCRKILSILLSCVMLLSLLPTGVFAEESSADPAACRIGTAEYATLTAALSAAQPGETVELLRDVEESITIGKPVTLNLNGFTLRGAGKWAPVVQISVLTTDAAAEIAVCNGSITGGTNGGINISRAVSGTYQPSENHADDTLQQALPVKLDRLTVTGNAAQSGGGLSILSGNVTLTGCEISGNTADNSGGGIYMATSGYRESSVTCRLTNSVVAQNRSKSNGGGLAAGAANYVSRADGIQFTSGITATYILENSRVTGNCAETSLAMYGGGGVYLAGNGSRFVMESGEISGNRAPNGCGGGILSTNWRGIELHGGTVADNDAGENGGGIFARNVNLRDNPREQENVILGTAVSVTGNTAGKNGGGIAVKDGVTLAVSPGSGLYNNAAGSLGDDVYAGGSKNNAVTLPAAETMSGKRILSSTQRKITDWYYDGFETAEIRYRWGEPIPETESGYYAVYPPKSDDDSTLALKAAHGAPFVPVDPDSPGQNWTVSKSKTATNLDGTYRSQITLALPAKEEPLTTDVVLVLDKSTSAAMERQAMEMLRQLKERLEHTAGRIQVGVVIFNQQANVANEGAFFDLATEYGSIQAAVEQTAGSGTNLHAGLLAGKALLDGDLETPANRKYLIAVSDGITYLHGAEPTAVAWSFMGDGEKHWCGPDNWASKYGTSAAPKSWSAWLTSVKQQLERQGTDYDYPYGTEPENCTPAAQAGDYANSVDTALYEAYAVYHEAQAAGYHCYALPAESGGSTEYPWGPNFMEFLSDGKRVSFDDIHDEIYYLIAGGSSVLDTMGYTDGAYNFDFIPKIDAMSMQVGETTLQAEVIGENRFGFGKREQGGETEYDYTLTYLPGNLQDTEQISWEIHVPVSQFRPVQLTYTVALTDPKTAPGTYGAYDADGSKGYAGLHTNIAATLYPVDSDGAAGVPENFYRPTVSYTVSGGSMGSYEPPRLNTKDHTMYIVGYPEDYRTGEFTADSRYWPVKPEADISRAEVAVIFFRLLEENTRQANLTNVCAFSDVEPGAWYATAVATMAKLGIVSGYPDGSFGPNQRITRGELATIAAKFDSSNASKTMFSDLTGHWSAPFVERAAGLGWVRGYPDGTFRPDRNITRAEAITLINHVLGRLPESAADLDGDMHIWPDNQNPEAWYYLAVQEATVSHRYTVNSDGKTERWAGLRPDPDWLQYAQ